MLKPPISRASGDGGSPPEVLHGFLTLQQLFVTKAVQVPVVVVTDSLVPAAYLAL